MLPEKYMGAVMFGNGCSGIIMNLIKMLIIAFLPSGPERIFKNELIFCMVAAFLLLFCSAGFSILQKNQFYIHFKTIAENQSIQSGVLTEDQITDQDSMNDQHRNLVDTRSKHEK